MCGRFTLTSNASELQVAFPWLKASNLSCLRPSYNISPGQQVAVVPNDGTERLQFFKWGFIPAWSKDPNSGKVFINARAESLAEKPSFRVAYRLRRCLVIADGFYEWKKEPGLQSKTPMYARMKSWAPFAFAGLWAEDRGNEGQNLRTCLVVTTAPNAVLEPIHNRMPVILPAEAHENWLDPADKPPHTLDAWLQPFPAKSMMAHPVSTTVNNPRRDSPDFVIPT